MLYQLHSTQTLVAWFHLFGKEEKEFEFFRGKKKNLNFLTMQNVFMSSCITRRNDVKFDISLGYNVNPGGPEISNRMNS